MTTVNPYSDAVRQFMRAFRQPFPSDQPATHANRARMLSEELEELKAAKRKVDLLDALMDMWYVAEGGILEQGINSNDAHHIAEMTSELHQPYTVAIPTTTNEAKLFYGTTLFFIWDRLATYFPNLDPLKPFEEVHRSNMSKIFPLKTNFQKALVEAYRTPSMERLGLEIIYLADEEGAIVKLKGKVQKPGSYSPADLSRFVK